MRCEQLGLLPEELVGPAGPAVKAFSLQLLKWIGNKQRFAHEIVGYFPTTFGRYIEPFLGSGAVLGTLAPTDALAGDVIQPLIELWQRVGSDPEVVKGWYSDRWSRMATDTKEEVFSEVRESFNQNQNPADFVFLSRACYGGVIRFRQKDGYMSTPCGAHTPIPPAAFARRVDEWHRRVKNTVFKLADFEKLMEEAQAGDVVYCDPPYSHSQSILYGAQRFDLRRLLAAIERCKSRGAYVLLSIDGTKRSGDLLCDIPIPLGLFEEEAFVNCGRSMLRRFQMRGESLEGEVVRDRLLLTY